VKFLTRISRLFEGQVLWWFGYSTERKERRSEREGRKEGSAVAGQLYSLFHFFPIRRDEAFFIRGGFGPKGGAVVQWRTAATVRKLVAQARLFWRRKSVTKSRT